MNIQRLFRKKDYLLARLGQMPRGTLVYRKNGIILWQYRRKEDGKRIQQRVKPEELAEMEARFQEKRRLMQSLKNVEVLLQKCGAEERRKARKAWERKKQAYSVAQKKEYSGQYRHYTLHGEYVSSKSEVLIADYLYMHRVPYEYEKPLKIEGITFYPDFTICFQGTNIYVEHLGLLDDPHYRRQWRRKRIYYNKAGIYEGFNLICTREIHGAIDMQEVDRLFREMGLIKKDWNKIIRRDQEKIRNQRKGRAL